jgi:hypothetical protein
MRKRKLALVLAAFCLGVLGAMATVKANPIPLPKVGQCPTGYSSGASYCTPPNPGERACVPKVGQCPSGYAQSGSSYCCEIR